MLAWLSSSQNKAPVCVGGKIRIPLDSLDDVFVYNYFATSSGKLMNKCCFPRQSPEVQYKCPLLGTQDDGEKRLYACIKTAWWMEVSYQIVQVS